ncbi:MAG: hypothetical protein U0R79_03285 [Propionicimonas sp.]
MKIYGATEEKDISLGQVHAADGGRIRYKRVCEVCGEEVPYAEIAKGYEAAGRPDGHPVRRGLRGAARRGRQECRRGAVRGRRRDRPSYFDRTYFLEAEKVGTASPTSCSGRRSQRPARLPW